MVSIPAVTVLQGGIVKELNKHGSMPHVRKTNMCSVFFQWYMTKQRRRVFPNLLALIKKPELFKRVLGGFGVLSVEWVSSEELWRLASGVSWSHPFHNTLGGAPEKLVFILRVVMDVRGDSGGFTRSADPACTSGHLGAVTEAKGVCSGAFEGALLWWVLSNSWLSNIHTHTNCEYIHTTASRAGTNQGGDVQYSVRPLSQQNVVWSSDSDVNKSWI